MIELPKTIRPLILVGDVIERLKEIPEGSVDLVVTSPPYWEQRDYGVKNQIGREKTPEEYIRKMIDVGEEIKRTMKDTGSYFLNIGDKYVGKDLQMIPFKVALEMQKKGWIVRNIIVWYKPNHMPTSIGDRLANTWEPVFFFVKGTGKYYKREYYVDLDTIRIPHKTEELNVDLPLTLSEEEYENKKGEIQRRLGELDDKYRGKFKGHEKNMGASPGARQSVSAFNYSRQRRHKITTELETEIIQYLRKWREQRGICPKKIDELLGKKDTAGHWFRLDPGRSLPRPEDWFRLKGILNFDDKYDKIMTETHYVLQVVKPHPKGKNPGDMWSIELEKFPEAHFSIFPTELARRIIKAFCPPNGIVLDPFAGSGTTGKAAMELKRRSILIDVNPQYERLMQKRCGLEGKPLSEFFKNS